MTRCFWPRVHGPLPLRPPGAEWCIRVSGEATCATCGEKYFRHPLDFYELSHQGEPYLHVGCDGMRLKL